MSNHARVVVEIKENIIKEFETFLDTHPLKECISNVYTLHNGDKVYDFECNHYDRITPNLEEWMYDTFNNEDWKMIGIDEYSHWDEGWMDCPAIWLDISIGE